MFMKVEASHEGYLLECELINCKVSLTCIKVEPLANWWRMAELDAYSDRLRDLHAASTLFNRMT